LKINLPEKVPNINMIIENSSASLGGMIIATFFDTTDNEKVVPIMICEKENQWKSVHRVYEW
jgi:hypothetical protein